MGRDRVVRFEVFPCIALCTSVSSRIMCCAGAGVCNVEGKASETPRGVDADESAPPCFSNRE